MTSIINQLWMGNVEPCSHAEMNSIELRQLETLKERNREKLFSELNEKQKELLEKYCDTANELLLAYAEQSFCDGFCFGTKIIAEALLT